jgi:microcystin-dependent protein
MSTPFMGQIEIFSFNFAPKGWALCNGQLLPINQNQALFSLLGTMYGGDGRVNFGLPDLRSRIPISFGPQNNVLGMRGGEENHTLNMAEMAAHNHFVGVDGTAGAINKPATTTVFGTSSGVSSTGQQLAINAYSSAGAGSTLDPRTISNTGGSQAHTNIQPYLTLNLCIALQGIFPSQN